MSRFPVVSVKLPEGHLSEGHCTFKGLLNGQYYLNSSLSRMVPDIDRTLDYNYRILITGCFCMGDGLSHIVPY